MVASAYHRHLSLTSIHPSAWKKKKNSRKFAVSRSPAVLLFGTPRAAHGSLLEPEGSVFVTHGTTIRYERLRLATPRHFLLGHPFRGYMHIRKRSQLGKAFARVYSTGTSLRVGSAFGGAPWGSPTRG